MHELTERGKAFRAAIAGFIGNKLKKIPKDKDGNFAPATDQECAEWLAKAVEHVARLHVATHVLKATHGDAAGSDVFASPPAMRTQPVIGTQSLAADFDVDIVASSAAYLGASSFYRAEAEGHQFAHWIEIDDADFRAALHADDDTARSWMGKLRSLKHPDAQPSTHPMAKQLYWLIGDTPQDDGQYHLLQPMFSSSLAQAVHIDIQDARFSEISKAARQARRDNKPGAPWRDYRGLAVRKLGGTKPQNISQLNSERGGVNYLLASLPPSAWKPRDGVRLLGRETVFGDHASPFLYFGEVRELIRELADFLKTDPEPNKPTRDRVAMLGERLADALAIFGTEVRGPRNAGWTRDATCRLPLCEQLWLDPDRTELPLRDAADDPNGYADDLVFNAAYAQGDWADEVAERFGRWLNHQLRQRSDKLAALGAAEMRHFAGLAILDVAWPIPLQRRVKAGAA